MEEKSTDTRTDDQRRAGAYGFSRIEIRALLVVVIVTGVAGLYRWWEQRSAASTPGWVIEDVLLDGSPGASSPDDEGTVAPATDTLRVARPPAETAVDINTATVSDLVRLPGIGAELARRIVQERAKNGPYADLADLKRVRGIGSKKAAALAGWVRFTPPVVREVGRRPGDTVSATEE